MPETDPAQARRVRQVLWLSLLAAQLVYAGVILAGTRTAERAPDLPALPAALALVALATGVGAQVAWRRASAAGRAVHLTPPDPGRSFAFFVVTWVLDESLAIYGLVLGLLAFPAAVWAPFSLAALGLMLVHRPA